MRCIEFGPVHQRACKFGNNSPLVSLVCVDNPKGRHKIHVNFVEFPIYEI